MTFQRANGRLAFVAISHRDKSESTGFTTHAIGYYMDVSDGAMGREEFAQFGFGGGERKITYVQFHKHLRSQSQSRSRIPGFKIITEEASADDLPRNQLEQSSSKGRPDRENSKRHLGRERIADSPVSSERRGRALGICIKRDCPDGAGHERLLVSSVTFCSKQIGPTAARLKHCPSA